MHEMVYEGLHNTQGNTNCIVTTGTHSAIILIIINIDTVLQTYCPRGFFDVGEHGDDLSQS